MIQNNVLNITTTRAQLAFSSVAPVMRDRYLPAQLDIEHTPASLSIHSADIRCEIDSSACFAEEGHKTIGQLTADFAQQGMDDAREGAHDATLEVWQVLEAAPREPIAQEQARAKIEQLGASPEPQLTFVPSVRPTITWIPNQLSEDYEPSQLQVNWQTTDIADVGLERQGSISYWMAQEPSIDIQYVGDADSLPHHLDVTA